MHPRAILARNLKRLRAAKGMSQEELAHEAGVNRTYVSDLERGRSAASVDKLASFADVFGVRASDLINEEFVPDEGGA